MVNWLTRKDGQKFKSDEFIYGEGSMSNTIQVPQSEHVREKELADFAEGLTEEQYQKLEKELQEQGRLEQTGLVQMATILRSSQTPRLKLERMRLLRKSPYYTKLGKEEKEDFNLAMETLEGQSLDPQTNQKNLK